MCVTITGLGLLEGSSAELELMSSRLCTFAAALAIAVAGVAPAAGAAGAAVGVAVGVAVGAVGRARDGEAGCKAALEATGQMAAL